MRTSQRWCLASSLLRPSSSLFGRAPSLPPPPPHTSSASCAAKDDSSAGNLQLERVYERALAADRALSSQQEMLTGVQRQQLLLERRIAEMEDMAVALQAQVTEARRAAGQVALAQQNVELLVEQMEQRVLHMPTTAATPAEDAPREAPTEVPLTHPPSAPSSGHGEADVAFAVDERSKEELRAQIREVLLSTEGTLDAPAAASHQSDAVLRRLEALERRLDTLQASVDHLTLHKVDLTHVAAASLKAAAEPVEAGSLQRAADSLAEKLRLAEAVPFKDPTGAVRLLGQVVSVSSVPANMGAAEVREMCVRACGRGSVVSCVVAAAQARSSSERTFHVTFATVQLAARAVTELRGLRLTASGSGPALVAEPVVSADLQAALQLRERQKKGK